MGPWPLPLRRHRVDAVAMTDAISPSATAVPTPLPQFRAVLVPLDGSPTAERALSPARWLAANFGAELHTVTAGVSPGTGWYRRYVAQIGAEAPGIVTHTSATAHAAGTIAAVSRDLHPCLVCIGTHGRARSAALLGSTFVDLARHLGRPLVAVGRHARLPLRSHHGRIVACVDGSTRSELVLPVAAAWAERLALRLSILHVSEPHPAALVPDEHRHRPFDPDRYVEDIARRPYLAALGATPLVAWGPVGPDDGLEGALAAEPATLVALASRLRTGAGRALHGSDAACMVHLSPAPVLVVPAGDPDVTT